MEESANQPKFLYARGMAEISEEEYERGRSLTWSDDDLARILGGDAKAVSTFKSLPVHLQVLDVVITTDGHRRWDPQVEPDGSQLFVPPNSVVHLFADSGYINMGWGPGNLVDSRGYFSKGPFGRPADSGFLLPTCNRYCFVVKMGDQALRNAAIKNYGASVGDLTDVFWNNTNPNPQPIYAGFNDEDDNNSGRLTQRIRRQPLAAFLAANRNVFKTGRARVTS